MGKNRTKIGEQPNIVGDAQCALIYTQRGTPDKRLQQRRYYVKRKKVRYEG